MDKKGLLLDHKIVSGPLWNTPWQSWPRRWPV